MLAAPTKFAFRNSALRSKNFANRVRRGCPRPGGKKVHARQNKPHKAEHLAQAIDHWLRCQHPDLPGDEMPRPANLHALHDWLRQEFAYDGSYKSVVRFVRANYPKPRCRPYRRVETPPGAQAQVDWGTCSGIDIDATSSMNSVPRCASSNRPTRALMAPVNAPLT